MSATIGLLHPGAMGASVGRAFKQAGSRVLWAEQDRGQATRDRADQSGFDALSSLDELVSASDVIVSVCPPAAALDVANAVAKRRFGGMYLDANAVAPGKARLVGDAVAAGGADFIDGGIIGPPADRAGTTRLYLSGNRASDIARLLDGSLLDARTVNDDAGAASALKMAYAAYTKGTTALLLNIRALALKEGIETALLDEWGLSQSGVEQRSERAARDAAKAWRFEGEMHEIADTFAAANLPDEFHRGAARLYGSLGAFKNAESPALEPVLAALNAKK